MAAHHISLAKASFGASLLRPDVTKVSRDDLPTFHNAFEAALARCSNRNIQTCKQWLLENVVVSAARTNALGKYLVTISRHLASQADEAIRASVPRRRLHILYLINDLLHHAKHHDHNVALRNNLAQSLQPFLADLFQLGASEAKPRVRRRMFDLIELWKEEEYFGKSVADKMHDVLAGVPPESEPTYEPETQRKSADKELPYLIPSTHGDPSLPFYDLPAGNLMRHIIPNSSQPIRPDEVRALQFSAGPADESLVTALKDFLNDVKGFETTLPRLEQSGLSPEIDELGQISYHNEAGDVVGDTYYGWSRSFCDKMKKRGRRSSADSSRRSRSQSSDRSRSATPQKRRRRSISTNGRSRSSRSYSRSPPARRSDKPRRQWGRSHSRSRSRSRSYSPSNHQPRYEQPPRFAPSTAHVNANIVPVPPPPPQPSLAMPFPPMPLPTGVPVPPPRPPQWVGPWPPPPPPQFAQGSIGYHNAPFSPHPPPPPTTFVSPPNSWGQFPGASSGQNNQYGDRR
ncbi:hypothetical protein AYL99_03893 [Fonsecaea erecta]|uniref:CID domain-containing protein n=1 Tax=Fonsecaea erecta TaxID=1367422 RepID=A0A178ZPF3_9EURO|nr:hypothetical protein AYL99_03893 [Fonsecaea erecta]OAP61690.1 hypothetical protein AYL99_03893 [Fonsecaea erecta]